MKTVKEISKEDINDTFDSVILSRGEEYFYEDCVEFFEIVDSTTIRGTVSGNQDYDVSITVDEDGELVCECSCPCDFNCKHAAALLLYWMKEKKKNKKANPREGKKQTINELLQKKSKEELIIILKDIFEKHRELEVLAKINPSDVKSKIKRLFSRYWEWNQVRNLVSQLNLILERIQKNISSADRNLYEEMLESTEIVIEGQNNVHGEDEISIFLQEWLKVMGDIFSRTNPTKEEKITFIERMMLFQKEDDYGLEDCLDEALLGMCKTHEDIELIKEHFLKKKQEEEYGWSEEDAQVFILELYAQTGADEDYLNLAEKEKFYRPLVDKLMSLGKLLEAIEVCDKGINKDYYHFMGQKARILEKLGEKEKLKETLYKLIMHSGYQVDVKKLKKECSGKEWKSYLQQIITDAEKRNRDSFLSRLYYDEKDYPKAYDYSKDSRDDNYMQLLAKKLEKKHPVLACQIYEKLCFSWIDSGSGFCYKEAGRMLKAIKKLDGDSFREAKRKVTFKHNKKWSLMKIVGRV